MNRIDFDKIAAGLNPATLVPQWLPDGKRVGSEWVARNPTRADNRPGSFSINLQTGAWADFATGDEGGDLISLWAYLQHNNDNGAAARELADQQGITFETTAPAVRDIRDAKPRVVMPAPADAGQPDFRHPTHGQPSAVWPYYDRAGKILLFVCRFDHADGRKDICPLSWCEHPGKAARWTWRGPSGTDKRPIYGQDRLAALTDADVLVVEGEKAADAAQRLVGRDMAVIAWLGGTGAADRADLRPLMGRRVFLWPDFDRQADRDGNLKPLHDQPGMKAMLTIAKGLAGIASTVMLVGYDHTADKFAAGWDLADAEAAGWKAANVRQFLELHAGDPFEIAGGRADPVAENLPENAKRHDDPIDEEIERLGLFKATPDPANDNAARPLDVDLNPYGFPHLSDKGQPQNTVENVAHLLAEYGITAGYNVISKEVEIDIPGRAFSQDNRAANAIATIGSLCARNRVPQSSLVDYINVIADANRRNPALEWIEAAPWDGVDRFGDLVETLDPADAGLAVVLVRRWMIGAAAAAACDKGVAMQGVLVLQGPQNSGKTTWFWTLAGGRDRGLMLEGAQLNPADRDSVKTAISHWLVELGELDATFRKADIAALKAFITRDRDELRLPYMRASSCFPRRTAFGATVNEGQYLRDDTGNRRYWTVKHGAGLVGMHTIDVQQVWAQALHLWRQGEPHALTRDELAALNAANEKHTEVSPIEELLAAKYDWSNTWRGHAMTATEALIAIGYDRPNRAQTREAGMILRKLTQGEPRKTNGREVYDMPPKTQEGHF
jgi:hypothetical protein